MASEVDSEKMTLVPSSPHSGNDPQSGSVSNEDNAVKQEKTGDVGSSGDSAPKEEGEFPDKIKREETEKARDIKERGDGFKHTDEADEDKHQDQDMNSYEKAKPEPEPSLQEKTTTTIPSSPPSGNDPQSESVMIDDKVDKPEQTGGEFPDKIKKLEETEKARDIKERCDGFKHTDEADEDKHQDQDMNSYEKAKPEPEPSLQEKTTTTIPSSPPSGNDPQSESVMIDDKVDKPEQTGGEFPDKIKKLKETEKARDIKERCDGFKHTDEADEDKHQDQDMNSDEKAKPEPEPSLNEPPVIIQRLNEAEEARDVNESGEHTDETDEEIEPPVIIQRLNEAEEARDVNESGEHTDETDEEIEPPVIIQRLNEAEEARDVNESGEHTDETDEEIEPPVIIQRLNEAEEARDVNESGEHTDETDEEIEPPVIIQRLNEAEEARDVNESGEHTDETDEEIVAAGHPQDNQPPINNGWNDKLSIAVCVVLVACCVGLYFSDSTTPDTKEFDVEDVFNQEMEKLKTSFPNQRPELWRRSLIHIKRHLKTEQPTEPVSLILTSGHGAERTLDCLARCLAQAFSTARNSSFLNIDGKSKASQDSDQVKLDIDRELRNAFEGKKIAAVIHRFEELPPGSTLIFYRYCDHENAAYKNVFLAFTIMLDGEVEVPPNVNLGRVEEMVQEHVKQKFVSSDKLATFNQMDVDKLSGLWSRISHLILPVAAEQKIEQQGCRECDKSF